MLFVNKISCSFGRRLVLQQLCLSLAQGEIGTLIGPSGSGKTTFFRLLTGLIPVQEGEIVISENTPPHAYQHIAYMMQEDLLLPWRTTLDNLLLVGELGRRKKTASELKSKALKYLAEVGLEGWENAYPEQLSGGMRQRVSLARALLQQRPVLLLDEPFAALDVALREQMHELLKGIRGRYGTTILLITHDFRDALALSDRIFMLSNGCIEETWNINSSLRQNPESYHHLHEQLRQGIKKSTFSRLA